MSMGSEIMEEYYDREIIPKYKAVIEAQKEYIKFLGKDISRYASVCVSHKAMQTPLETIAEGKVLRAKISELESKL